MSIRRLHRRKPQQELANDVRRRRQGVIRLVYLGSILLLALWLGDLFLGSFFYLRSQGRVVGEAAVVAVEFSATVRDIQVHEGDRVTPGQVVAVISSQSVTENLARLMVERVDRTLRLGDARVRMATVNAVINLATRQDVTSDTRRRMESLLAGGFLPFEHRIAALESEFKSREDLARLTAEQGALTAQIVELSHAVAEAGTAIEGLRRLYDGGVLRASIGGIVGRRLAENGTVLSSGQPLLELYDNSRFCTRLSADGWAFHGVAGRARGDQRRSAALHGHDRSHRAGGGSASGRVSARLHPAGTPAGDPHRFRPRPDAPATVYEGICPLLVAMAQQFRTGVQLVALISHKAHRRQPP